LKSFTKIQGNIPISNTFAHYCIYTFTHWDMFGFKQEQLPSEDSRKAGSEATCSQLYLYLHMYIAVT